MPDRVTAREYHERTKHTPERLRESDFDLDFSNKPTPFKVYQDLPSVGLPDRVRPPQVPALAAIADSGPSGDSGASVGSCPDLDALTLLCYYSAGITRKIDRGGRELRFRAAACTGALYHVDLYVVARDLPELDAGVYHFDPRTLSLDVLREGDYRGVLAEATGHDERVTEAPVTFVATSTWWRNAWKYRERTYRHAFWDSGTVLANLLAVAHSLDLPASVVAGFADQQVADLLGVDVEREAPLELVPVGTGTGEQASGVTALETISPATEPLSRREKQYDLISAAYRGSTLEDGRAAREWREGRPDGSVGTRPSGDGRTVALDPVDDARASKTPLHWTIRRRGSCRKYDRETLNFRKVSTVLDRAISGFPADFRDPDGPPLQFNDCYLVVHDVADVPPGAYHYHPAGDGSPGPDERNSGPGELELLREGDFRQEAAHLALDQRLAADAGLCAFFLTDVEAVTDRLDDRGYRVAQLEAALTAGKLYLAVYAHRDLGATGLTFYDDEVTEFFGPRSEGQTPTFLWTLGRPA